MFQKEGSTHHLVSNLGESSSPYLQRVFFTWTGLLTLAMETARNKERTVSLRIPLDLSSL
jgi:hypothetical protein